MKYISSIIIFLSFITCNQSNDIPTTKSASYTNTVDTYHDKENGVICYIIYHDYGKSLSCVIEPLLIKQLAVAAMIKCGIKDK